MSSLIDVKKYFRQRCLAIGLHEHKDAFFDENIASTVVDNSFHVLISGFNGVKLNQNDQEMSCRCLVSFWIKGFKNPSEGLDKAVAKSEFLIKEVLKPSNRFGQSIKNVSLGAINYAQMSESNDNSIKVTIEFTSYLILSV
jgi:hypothetical protein